MARREAEGVDVMKRGLGEAVFEAVAAFRKSTIVWDTFPTSMQIAATDDTESGLGGMMAASLGEPDPDWKTCGFASEIVALITEEAFDTQLNSIRAKVSLGMRVLTIDDIGFQHPGGHYFMAYLSNKESLAAQAKSVALNVLGLGGFP